jgi:prepilin-type N-terminal cleavage/methylation domain-containing protein
MTVHSSALKSRKGFTLVELAVVIVIIGVLAAFGVPKFLASVERSKAAEAFAYLSAVREAEERFIAQNGTYATLTTQLDITLQPPKYFTPDAAITAVQDSAGLPKWSLKLARIAGSSSYGAYTVTFTEAGYDEANSTISTYPSINPLGGNGSST